MIECSDSYHQPFPKRFRLLIDETRVSQQEIADRVGVSRQAISQWKNGVTVPDMYHFKKIAEFFKVPMEYLYGETESRVRDNIAVAEELGLSDKAVDMLKEWAAEKIDTNDILSLAPASKVLSDIMASGNFDEFIGRIRLYIVEHIEQRLHEDKNKELYDNEKAKAWTKRDADSYARLIGMRAIKADDLSTFYKYQAMEALERALFAMPEKYYIAYQAKKEGNDSGEHSAEEE